MEFFILSAVVALGLGIYYAPMIVAAGRQHPKYDSITRINILLGWTLVGWVVALAMACSGIKRDSPTR